MRQLSLVSLVSLALSALLPSIPACAEAAKTDAAESEQISGISFPLHLAPFQKMELALDVENPLKPLTAKVIQDGAREEVLLTVRGEGDAQALSATGFEPEMTFAPRPTTVRVVVTVQNLGSDWLEGRVRIKEGQGEGGGGGTTTHSVTLTSEIIGSSFYGDADSALASWRARCQEWIDGQKQLVGAERVDVEECGTRKNVAPDSRYTRYQSVATITVLTRLPAEFAPREYREQGLVVGQSFYGDIESADRSFKAACTELLRARKQYFGERFLAGHCPDRKNVASDSRYTKYQSDLVVFLKSASTAAPGIKLSNPILGASFYADADSALTSWRARCQQWVDAQKVLVGAELVDAEDCGTRVNVSQDSRYYRYQSLATLTVVPRTVGDAPIREVREDGLVRGESFYGDMDSAATSFDKACLALIQTRKAALGERFVAGHCPDRKNVASDSRYTKYQSDLVLFVRPRQ